MDNCVLSNADNLPSQLSITLTVNYQLLHRYALGKIPRFVYINAFCNTCVI